MKRLHPFRQRLSLAIVAGTFLASPAVAADLNVEISQSRMQKLSRPAATLIVGNPAIADVSIANSDTIVVLGRTYGQTNLIALDAAGQQIANFDLHVVETQNASVTLNRGAAQYTYSCTPRCVWVINPVDEQIPTDGYITTTTSFTSMAEDAAGGGSGN